MTHYYEPWYDELLYLVDTWAKKDHFNYLASLQLNPRRLSRYFSPTFFTLQTSALLSHVKRQPCLAPSLRAIYLICLLRTAACMRCC